MERRNEPLAGAAVIMAIGIIIMGAFIRSGIVKFKELDRVVSVKGLSEREVKADKATWALTYKEIGSDPTEMYQRIENKGRTVINFLKAGGIKDDEISVNPPLISDRQADNYGNEIMTYRYKAKAVITVTSSDVDKVRALISRQQELMKQGVAIVGEEYAAAPITYEFTKLNDIKPQMVEEATKNARATAEKFAADSGSDLGGIRKATQGMFSIEDRDATTPYIKRIRVVTTVEYTLE